MNLQAILEIISGVLQFPDRVLALIRILKKTPQENHEALLAKIATEAEAFQQTGRPSW